MEKTIRQDFERTIKDAGYSVGDFEVIEKDYTEASPNAFVRTKTTVKRKVNGKQKTYESGHYTKWLIDFENDLKLKFFE